MSKRHNIFFFLLTCVFFCHFSYADNSNNKQTPLQLLQAMEQAKDRLNYEMSFVQMTPINLVSLRYRHSYVKNKNYSQLVSLDGVQQEIVQNDNLIAYFNPTYQPFTINAEHIVDSLPSLMRVNFAQISTYYDFISMGRNRIANRIVQSIRILPKDNFRYQYIAFIDEETNLLLRADMLDRDGNLLEQFRVVNLFLSEDLTQLADYLNNLHFPPLLNDKKSDNPHFNWQPTWLPQGFKQISSNLEENGQEIIESRLYSDGLFSFNLYVSSKILPEGQENVWKEGAYTIYSETLGDKEITLIGQLPLSTAKRIVKDMQFNK